MSAPIFKKKHGKIFIKAEEIRKLIDSAEDLLEIVEGVRCQDWRARGGSFGLGPRFKDTPEWVTFYVALKRVLRE
jgi:hypothetical protein